ncbi:DUF2244 domain-containing protein [Nevskia soli]|uniref:DUF2244 domain-containing protein n=1 Tax=Nevskia soli TaxID=418856 RepID=UPI00068DAC93|nr:DUF2244 domain-containing protein [Nevskia soli]
MQYSVNTRLVIGPNASMSVRQAVWFMAWMCAVSLAIGGFFALKGFWPILPFAGLELVALAAALAVSLRRNRYREVVDFDQDAIRVEVGEIGRGAGLQVRFTRSSTRVLLETGPYRNSPSRLLLSSLGQSLELGRCLTDEERERLAARMRELIHPGWRRKPDGRNPESAPG